MISLWHCRKATIPVSYTHLNAKYVPIVEEVARENGVSFRAIHLQSKEEAQNAPTPVTTYALFYDGAYLTNEQMNDRKFLKLLSK